MSELCGGAHVSSVDLTNALLPNPRKLELCSDGERRLAAALQVEAFIIVNGLMLVKGLLKLAGGISSEIGSELELNIPRAFAVHAIASVMMSAYKPEPWKPKTEVRTS